ncbi:DNA-deoxyinosine glycosylase [Sphingobium terrigena]|uniref:DNA-deoxyinosine glycosylase n=1 Tax=Sphingobium terrigena TaxID=2304063 RepID=A0A418YX41_9SPHN|nr:DNA-deoxyinosine glycosylase [Sphingobium terrigena]RJG57154.1 DNA-deoxyinosine glycosylase [Sphingobium terrigena]
MPPKFAFPPSVDASTRLLILGSLPGDVSIARQEYYAHRGNAFWALIGDVLGEALAGQPYPLRLARLQARGVGLWDVMASATRPGSLDSAISDADVRDLGGFIAALPALQAVAFNGKMAALHGRRQLGDRDDLALIDLPSSSGAHATVSRGQKVQAWRVLCDWIV